MTTVIPDSVIDERLAIVGTSGSGKTYLAGLLVERLLASGARVVIIDPLDVWWGLRLRADGRTPSIFQPVIFGGRHADLPLIETAGALLGETVATMAESAIVSLTELRSSAARRRFMRLFLEALYERTDPARGEPYHLVVDEADLWAPQNPVKGAEALLGEMEEIVRRGRVKGFIPWLITQRPAVFHKDVLSQADGLVAMKLTSSQDRNAIRAWIAGQADQAEEKRILAALPGMNIGEGIVWVPGHGILEQMRFSEKTTFDSSRTPKRGEKRRKTAELQALDLPALKERMAAVETDAKANDPAALKAEIAKLQREAATLRASNEDAKINVPSAEQLGEAERRGWEQGVEQALRFAGDHLNKLLDDALKVSRGTVAFLELERDRHGEGEWALAFNGHPVAPAVKPKLNPEPRSVAPAPPVGPAPARDVAIEVNAEGLTPAKRRILVALRQLQAIGRDEAPKDNVAWFAGVSPKSSGFSNNLGALRSARLIDYPRPGTVTLTADGEAIVPPAPAPSHADIVSLVQALLSSAQFRILAAAIERYPEAIGSDQVAERAGASPASSGFSNNKGRLRSLGLIDYPAPGQIRAADVLFP